MQMKGIDISKYQGNVDFNQVKASGIDFVIIRAGYGKTTTQKDPKFEEYYKKAKEANLYVGTYWYSYAKTEYEALQEAKAFEEVIKNKTFEMPVFLDIEESSQATVANVIITKFCDYLETKNYYVGVYGSKSYLESYTTQATTSKYCTWVAQWSDVNTYKRTYDLWQYSDKGKIPGITGDVDLDYCYKDLPTIIKKAGKNGFTTDKKKHIQLIIDGTVVFEGDIDG